jgi:shikimate dehydrogenase
MHGQAPLDIDLADLPVRALVNDIVYTPREPNLLISAKQRGNAIVGGLGMLLHQARPGFFSWFGINPKVTDALRKHVIMALKK